jgi:hypothetical protein
MRKIRGGDFPTAALADAHHHLFLDQPLAFAGMLPGMIDEVLGG